MLKLFRVIKIILLAYLYVKSKKKLETLAGKGHKKEKNVLSKYSLILKSS